MIWQGGVVVDDVVDHRGISGLGVYRREEGEETVNMKQTVATEKHDESARSARVL